MFEIIIEVIIIEVIIIEIIVCILLTSNHMIVQFWNK